MNVLIDANVVFDVVEKRQPHYTAPIRCSVCAAAAFWPAWWLTTPSPTCSISTVKPAVPFLKESLLPHVRTVSADSPPMIQALAWGMTDFEDALQAAAARANGAAFIISRNVKDFKLSHVPAVTPSDYLARFHPA